ncbi:MAG: hypothetical protein JWR19_4096 [Pedosphaera sp.]|nr:hypothetical protein [Pedosphaera sp.]
MASIDAKLTEQFHHWERRGRGWQVFPYPVVPEPPFRPFYGHYLPQSPAIDDGRRPTVLSSLVQRLSRKLSTEAPSLPPVIEEVDEPEPHMLVRDSLIELQTSLPANLNINREAFEQFLSNLSLCREPVAFELFGVSNRVTLQFATHSEDAPLVRRQLQAHFPEGMFHEREGTLEKAWEVCEGEDALVVEFGLAREFMLPLAGGKLDPFVGIIGALSELQPGELGLFQVLFQPTHEPWAESIVRSVTHADGKPFFVNQPELAGAAQNKVAHPLYAAVVRILVRSECFERTLQIARDLAGSLRVFAHPQCNELIPLENSDYPFEEHVEDALRRQSRRSGMLLSSDELMGFVHLPSSAVRSPVLQRETGKTKAAPAIVRGESGVLLGSNAHADDSFPVRLTAEQRVQHMHVIGVQGTGKSTLLFNLIRQDIENGEGVAVLDPHGDLIEQILGIIPPERIHDVVLVDPSDEEYSVGFNILSAHSDAEKRLLASDLVSVFQRLSTSWGDQMGSVLQNAILAFLESSRGGTLVDLRRFLLEPAFRAKYLETVGDPNIVYYWRKGFSQLAGNKSIGSVITRLNDFLAPKPIRYMVSQPVNRLDFRDILDSGKIFLAKLPQGQMGKENSFLLGSLLVSKFQQMVMARQAQRVSVRKDFWLYIDEFHNFITPSMAEILTGARKYRLGLILAHQELRQLERDREVASAVLANPFTRVAFRVGDADARALENGFSFFEARDLQNLGKGQAITRVEKADFDFNLTVPLPEAVNPEAAQLVRQAVVEASRMKYAVPRAQVEAAEQAEFNSEAATPDPVKPKPTSPSEAKPAKPTAAEVRQPTVSEKEAATVIAPEGAKPEIPASPIIEATTKSASSDRGIGGHQHNLIRERIETVARELGFYAAREKLTATGQKIDLALEKDNQVIACEISIMTTVDHEVGNVAKCLKAGCQQVAVICASEGRLAKIQMAVSGCLLAEEIAKVGYYLPDQFIDYLQKLPAGENGAANPQETVLGKYKVKSRASKLSPEETRTREASALKMLAETMRRKT